MPDERTYYVICEDSCKFESMTKEQILSAIEQAVSSGTITDVDTGFVTKIKEINNNHQLQFWVGTQAEYNAIDTPSGNVMYIITNDCKIDDIENDIETLTQGLTGVSTSVSNISDDVSALEAKNTTDNIASSEIAIASGWSVGLNAARKYGNVINLSATLSTTLAYTTSDSTPIAKIASSYAPVTDLYVAGCLIVYGQGVDSCYTTPCKIATDGKIYILTDNTMTHGGSISICCSWVVN